MTALMRSFAAGGPESYYQLFTAAEGDGMRDSSHILVAVGSSEAYVQQKANMDPDDNMKLKSVLKSYKSYIFTSDATENLKTQIDTINKGAKAIDIDLVESPMYSIPGGKAGIERFVEKAGNSLVIRIEDTHFENEADMTAFEEASAKLFGAPHRQTEDPKYRMYQVARGGDPEITSPIAFSMKKTDKDFLLVVFDEAETIKADTGAEAADETIAAGLGKATAGNLYYCGPGGSNSAVVSRVEAAKAKGLYANVPVPNF